MHMEHHPHVKGRFRHFALVIKGSIASKEDPSGPSQGIVVMR
jgi:hypothetical protein